MEYSQTSVASGGGVGSTIMYPSGQLGPTTKLGLESAHAELRGGIEELSKRLHSLEARLNPILSPAPPSQIAGEQTADAPEPSRSSTLVAVISAQRAVSGINQHIERILSRIEL